VSFQPYSGVKTSVLILDKKLSRNCKDVLFVKIENDGYDLGAQRREIEKNDLPEALKIINQFKDSILNSEVFKSTNENVLVLSRTEIATKYQHNLSFERFKEKTNILKSRYPMVKLGEISERITKGTTPTTNGFKFQEVGINFIKIESIKEDGSFIPEKFAFVSKECHQAFKRSQLKENDILFSIAGALGRIAIVTNEILPANTNQALAIITLKPEVYPPYVFWSLKSGNVLDEIENLKVGVAQLNLSLQQITDFEIPLPHLKNKFH
jgi:restriction endonuclease S subunit